MWIFTKDAMISVVKNRLDPMGQGLLARARLENDLETAFPERAGEVIELKTSDYRFRVAITPEELMHFLVEEAAAINYDNFKSAVAEPHRASAYMNVWGAMFRAQNLEEFD